MKIGTQMSNQKTGVLLLDTHVWVWLINGDEELKSSRAVPLIEDAGKRDAVKVSIMSVWEVGMLVAGERLDLRMDVYEWVHKALAAPGVSLAPLSREIALESSQLPGSFHGDPVDRILVASARNSNAAIVTRDRRILSYGKTRHVRVLRA